MTAVALFAAFCLKHFICDFPLQRAYHYENKGVYGHPGGLQHAGIHALGTLIVLGFFSVSTPLALGMAAVDALVHYHIDWAKARINRRYGLTPQKDAFWWLIGLDQLAHQLTYVGLIFWLL